MNKSIQVSQDFTLNFAVGSRVQVHKKMLSADSNQSINLSFALSEAQIHKIKINAKIINNFLDKNNHKIQAETKNANNHDLE